MNRVELLKDNIALLKENLMKAYLEEEYIEPEQYMANGILDPSKYTPEMLKKFKERCVPEGGIIGRCMNSDWNLCYLKSISCFNAIFNGIPEGLFAKTLEYMRKNGWENNNIENIKRLIKC